MTTKIHPGLFAILLIPLLAGAACGTPAQAPTQVAQATEVPIPSATSLPDTATPPPSPTPTTLPSETPTRTPTPSATPTATLPPPGGLIAFERFEWDYSTTLWLMNTDGSQLTRLLADENIGGVLWSPDGQKMAYFSRYEPGSDIGELKVFDRASGEIQIIIRMTGLGFWRLMSWSPDGHYLVTGAGTGVDTLLKVIDVVQRQTVAEMRVFLHNPTLFFSPDSSQLVMHLNPDYSTTVPVQGEEIRALQTIDFLSGQKNTLVEGQLSGENFELLAWLPDGRILFSWFTPKMDGDSWEMIGSLWTILPGVDDVPQPAQDYPLHLDRKEVINRMPEGLPPLRYSFSPDGNWIVGSSNDQQIYIISWETGEVVGPLAEGEYPVWLPED